MDRDVNTASGAQERGRERGESTRRATVTALTQPSADGNESTATFRSLNSDVETQGTTRRRSPAVKTTESHDADAMSLTKANMASESKRPVDSAFTQQRMSGWQPILTPYNVLPVLFILGLLFVPLGVAFLSASMGVQEHVFDYSGCWGGGASKGFVAGPGGAFEMRQTGPDTCELQFAVPKAMAGPVFLYYRLTNYYQNNRLYAKSYSSKQLQGLALTAAELASECDPLVGPTEGEHKGRVYYPCGLIANSYFTDRYDGLVRVRDAGGKPLDPVVEYVASTEKITWPGNVANYKQSAYTVDQILPPPDWKQRTDLKINSDGLYDEVPKLYEDERFMNWMEVAGLPTFRKLYGRYDEKELPAGTYQLRVAGNYPVNSFQGTKSVVLSTATWTGGKNSALGWGFIMVGGLLLVLGLIFLVMFIMSPRKIGDVSYLSWYHENEPSVLHPFNEMHMQNGLNAAH